MLKDPELAAWPCTQGCFLSVGGETKLMLWKQKKRKRGWTKHYHCKAWPLNRHWWNAWAQVDIFYSKGQLRHFFERKEKCLELFSEPQSG